AWRSVLQCTPRRTTERARGTARAVAETGRSRSPRTTVRHRRRFPAARHSDATARLARFVTVADSKETCFGAARYAGTPAECLSMNIVKQWAVRAGSSSDVRCGPAPQATIPCAQY